MKDKKPFQPSYIAVDYSVFTDPSLSPAAKLLFARLKLYAGKNGKAFPKQETLAREMCLSDRRVRGVLAELKRLTRIDWKRTRASCVYAIKPPSVWTSLSDVDRKDRSSLSGRELPNHTGRNLPTEKKSRKLSSEEQGLEGDTDSDYLPANRKTRDSQADGARARLPDGWQELLDLVESVLQRKASKSGLGRIISATPCKIGAEAVEAIQDAIRRGYDAESKHAPRSMSWFVSVVGNFWEDRQARALPPGARDESLDPADFRRMTEAIEVPDSRSVMPADRPAARWTP